MHLFTAAPLFFSLSFLSFFFRLPKLSCFQPFRRGGVESTCRVVYLSIYLLPRPCHYLFTYLLTCLPTYLST
ncbi:hypothetical protein GGR50DRAFT_654615 [Xylaria sp. CBS 124048]|nr:hypothetical protein GGR50DRAFT_654615 [Xylaria sp. CBS 124048]